MYSSSASIVIQAPRKRVWEALTKPEIIEQYFFGTHLDTDWTPGSPLFFRGEWEGRKYEDRGTVREFEPERTLSYDYWSSFSGHDDTPEGRQMVRYVLEDAEGGVKVTVHQSNVDTQERADHSKENWQGVLAGLKKLLEA